MFNLIPTTLKEKILKEYIQRRIVMWFFGVLVIMCIFSVFLLPTFVHVYFEEKNILIDSEVVKNSAQFKKADEVTRMIIDTNEQLKALAYKENTIDPIVAIQKIIDTKNDSIHIYEIEYTEKKATSSSLTIRGVADKRESLRIFVTNLEAVKRFSDIVLPVSNFAKDKDIDFTISINAL